MSASLCWRPVSDTGKHFKSGTSRAFDKLVDHLRNEVGASDVPALRAMAAASGDEFYNEVADTIESVGDIVLFKVY